MITIVVTVFNKQEYIRKCLDSIRSQSYSDFICFIVDDGSTDGSGTIAENIASNDARLHYHKVENRGVSAARNYGFAKAATKYIVFMDGDDWWEPRFLEKLVPHTDRDVAMVTATYCWHGDVNVKFIGGQNNKIVQCNANKYFFDLVRGNFGVHTSSTLVNAMLLRRIGGFPQDISIGEDSYCWDQLIYLAPLVRINEHLSNYNDYRPNGLTHKKIPIGPLPAYARQVGKTTFLHEIYRSKLFYGKLIYDFRFNSIADVSQAYKPYMGAIVFRAAYLPFYLIIRAIKC